MEPQAASATPETFDMRERPCPTCGTEARRTLGLRGGAYHRYGLGVATRIVQCETCELVFPNPFPYATKPAELYGDPDRIWRPVSPRVLEIGKQMVRVGRSLIGTPDPTMLDVGCGAGHLLQAARLVGLTRVVGLEISAALVNEGRERYGLEILRTTIEEYTRTATETFDMVMLSGVLEHVPDPDDFIACVRKLTAPGSVVYIDVPCEPSLITEVGNRLNRLRGDQSVLNLSPTWPPYHVFGFNPHALRTLLEKHGFRIEGVKVWGDPNINASKDLKDRLKAAVGTQINKLANLLGMSNNLSAWARRE